MRAKNFRFRFLLVGVFTMAWQTHRPARALESPCIAIAFVRCDETLRGATLGGTDQFSEYSCHPESRWDMQERVYWVDAPAGVQVRTMLDPIWGADLDLFAVAGVPDQCALSGCLGAGIEPDLTVEDFTFTVPPQGAFLVVESVSHLAGFDLTVLCDDPPAEVCDNDLDDDGNGETDCRDDACVGDAACAPPPEDCDNDIDDDGDEDADCADVDCINADACMLPPEQCDNGDDDDEDGAADCADADCHAAAACQSLVEDCDNDLDDDGDGDVDCRDVDCATFRDCGDGEAPREVCDNGVDDDGDGEEDCADVECDAVCGQETEICDNGRDDDDDGDVDCADATCSCGPDDENSQDDEGKEDGEDEGGRRAGTRRGNPSDLPGGCAAQTDGQAGLFAAFLWILHAMRWKGRSAVRAW